MSAYIGFLMIIVIEWFFLYPNGKIYIGEEIAYKQKKKFMIIICIELIFFAGFRGTDIGADTVTYLNALKYYSNLPHSSILNAQLVWPFDFEIGYFLLTKFAAWLSFDETMFLLLIATIIYIPVSWFIFKYSENPLFSVLTYFVICFGYSIGIFRQMIALSIVLVGTKYIWDRKLIKFLLTIGLAMTFHTTAIIMVPLYWLWQFKLENKLIWILFAEVICLFGARNIVLLAVKILPKYAGYVSGIYDIQGGSYSMLILLNVVLLFAFKIQNKTENKNNMILRMSVNATVMAIFLQILGYSMGIFGRIVPYYSIYLLILIPILLNRYLRMDVFAYFLTILSFMVLFYLLTKGSRIDPYYFIF